MDDKKNPLEEVKAMQKVAEALEGLDPAATSRILQWATGFYKAGRAEAKGAVNSAESEEAKTIQFADLAELHHATAPESDADKTLVAGYWAQFGEGKAEFGAMEINTALKNLGHPIKHITSAFDTLKSRKPAAVMQLKKSGTTKQARKTYRLTLAGKAAVEAMIQQK